MIVLDAFLEISYMSPQAYSEWADKLSLANRFWQFLELYSVARGLRDLAVAQTVAPDDYVMQIVNELGLRWSVIGRYRKYEGYANKLVEAKEGEPAFWQISIARDKATAVKGAEAHREFDNWTLGKLLGYPKCCIDAFDDRWRVGIHDTTLEAVKSTTGSKVDEYEEDGKRVYVYRLDSVVENNIFMRYMGIRGVPHLVCSFDCKESRELGRAFLELGSEYSVEATDTLKEVLSLPMVWDLNLGIVYVDVFDVLRIASASEYIPFGRHVVYINSAWDIVYGDGDGD